MSLKRVLIISYYWPPSAGSGVQRWLKFAKYLPSFGWQPVIYTPQNPDFSLQDKSLLKDVPDSCEVIKRKIWEPYQLASIFTSKKNINTGFVTKEKKQSLKSKTMNWVRGNILIPDPRVFWVKPSIKYLKKYLKENPVDAIVTTGPPHSMHLIGLGLKKALGIRWIVDIRDPWSKLDFLDTFLVNKRSRKKYESLESEVLTTCDYVLATSPSMPTLLMPFAKVKFHPITNGFDQDDFLENKEEKTTDHFTLFHAGLLNNLRDPDQLWRACAELCDENEAFNNQLRIHLVGMIDAGIKSKLANHDILKDKVILEDYKSHEEVLAYYQQASLLLLLINNTYNSKVNIPGKLFEYLAIQQPILAIGRQTDDAMAIVRETKSGYCHEYDDYKGIKHSLLQFFEDWQNNKTRETNDKYLAYSRRNLTRKLVEVLS